MKKQWKGIIGVILIVVSIASIFLWETYGREEFTYKTVVVLRANTEKGTLIKKESLGFLKVDRVIGGCITDPTEIIGLEAKQYIPAGTQLVADYFDDAGIVLHKDELIFALPNDWVLAYPQSMRRKDKIYVYPVADESVTYDPDGSPILTSGTALMDSIVAYAKDNSNQEVESLDPGRLTGSSNVSLVEIVATQDEINTLRSAAAAGNKFILAYQ